jgi:hypothetical protein
MIRIETGGASRANKELWLLKSRAKLNPAKSRTRKLILTAASLCAPVCWRERRWQPPDFIAFSTSRRPRKLKPR